MDEVIRCENPYEKVYKELQLDACNDQRRKAENLIKQLGFMYNIFGQAIKDFVKMISYKFQGVTEASRVIELKQAHDKLQNSLIEESNPTQKIRRKPSQLNIEKVQRQRRQKKKSIIMQPIAEIPLIKDLSLDFEIERIETNDSNTNKNETKLKSSKGRRAKQENTNKYKNFLAQFTKGQACELQSISIEKEENIFNFCDKSNTFKKVKETIDKPNKEVDQKGNNKMKLQTEVVQRVRHNAFTEQQEYQEKKDDIFRVAAGRSKKQRAKLNGITCIQCQEYYRVMQIGEQNICDCTSRHRSNRPSKNIKQDFTQQFDLA